MGNVRALQTGALQIIRQRLQLHGDGFELRLSDIEIVLERYAELAHQGSASHRYGTLQGIDFPRDARQPNAEFQDVLLGDRALSSLHTLLSGGDRLAKILLSNKL